MDIKTTVALCIKKTNNWRSHGLFELRWSDQRGWQKHRLFTNLLNAATCHRWCVTCLFPEPRVSLASKGPFVLDAFPPRGSVPKRITADVFTQELSHAWIKTLLFDFFYSEFALNPLIRSYSKFPNPPLFNHSLAVKHAIVIIDKIHIQVTQPFICLQSSSPSRFW